MIHSFPPIAHPSARLLILGSMPGVASLQAQQYYAHPQNLFWKIMAEAFNFDAALSYTERTAQLITQQIAVWDVLQSCQREGSLDVDIDKRTAIANDFPLFFAAHPNIERVCFNGSAAHALFKRKALLHLPNSRHLDYRALPSTSPANASISRADKIRDWRAALLFETPL